MSEKAFFVAMLLGEHLTIFKILMPTPPHLVVMKLFLMKDKCQLFSTKRWRSIKTYQMNFRKQIKKLCSDNAAWVTKRLTKNGCSILRMK